MSTTFTLLGTASSGGVPRVGPVWGACDPANPKNRRRRCALLVDRFAGGGRTTVLVDTPADLREQRLDARVTTLDGVLYTHDHAEHTHGIDDLRGVFFNMRRRVHVWADTSTRRALESRFEYCFVQKPGSLYPSILQAHDIQPPNPVRIEGAGGTIEAVPIVQNHGDGTSLGFRFGDVAYSSDLVDLDDAAFAALEGLEVWIVDALRYRPHPTHAHLERTLGWIERARPKRAILTNMHIDMDYAKLAAELPPGVEPAYDGLRLQHHLGAEFP